MTSDTALAFLTKRLDRMRKLQVNLSACLEYAHELHQPALLIATAEFFVGEIGYEIERIEDAMRGWNDECNSTQISE